MLVDHRHRGAALFRELFNFDAMREPGRDERVVHGLWLSHAELFCSERATRSLRASMEIEKPAILIQKTSMFSAT